MDLAPAINKGSHITLAIKEECISAILVFPNRGKKVKANLRPLFFRERGLSFLSFRRVENITVQLHYNEQMRSHFYRELFVPDIMRFWPNLLRDYKSLRSLKVVVIDQRHDLDAKPEKLLQILAPLKDLMKLHQDKIVIEGLGNVTRREFTQACCSRAAVFTLSNSAPCECS